MRPRILDSAWPMQRAIAHNSGGANTIADGGFIWYFWTRGLLRKASVCGFVLFAERPGEQDSSPDRERLIHANIRI